MGGLSEGEDEGIMAAEIRLGWNRTYLLALGAAIGVILAAYLIHLWRTK